MTLTREQQRQEIKDRAEDDLEYFAKLVNTHRVFGSIHEELFSWWTRESALDNQLCLLPRDHQKSFCAAVYAATAAHRNTDFEYIFVAAVGS